VNKTLYLSVRVCVFGPACHVCHVLHFTLQSSNVNILLSVITRSESSRSCPITTYHHPLLFDTTRHNTTQYHTAHSHDDGTDGASRLLSCSISSSAVRPMESGPIVASGSLLPSLSTVRFVPPLSRETVVSLCTVILHQSVGYCNTYT